MTKIVPLAEFDKAWREAVEPAWRSHFGGVVWEDLDAPGPEHEWLVDGWLSVGERSVVAGISGSGKSFLAIELAMCVARGERFFDNRVERGLVIYQAGEGARGIKKRLRAYRQHHGVTGPLPFVLLTSSIDLMSEGGDTKPLIEEVQGWQRRFPEPLRLIVIDTLATATTGGDENSGKDMGQALKHVAQIAEATGAHVMLVHHMNAGGAKVRGHTSIQANVDQVIGVVKDAETSIRTATLVKQKDEEDGGFIKFELMQVRLGYDKHDRPVTSCVVLPIGEKEVLRKREEVRGFALRPQEEVFFRALMAGRAKRGQIPDNGVLTAGCPLDQVIVHYEDWRNTYAETASGDEEGNALSKDAIRKRFERISPSLVKFGVIGWHRPHLWWTGKPVRGFPQTFAGHDADKPQPNGAAVAAEAPIEELAF